MNNQLSFVVKPPNPVNLNGMVSIFLAGTIDNGNSEDWQTAVQDELKNENVIVLNPRRDEWDSSWEQSIDNPKFKEQVDWELNGLEQADIVFMYFAPKSQSPITLLELGLFSRRKNVVVVCSSEFWRSGNVEVVCDRFNIPLYRRLEDGVEHLKSIIEQIKLKD